MRTGFERKNIRLPAENYRGERTYFLTLCFEGRRPYGAEPETARKLIRCLRESSAEKGFLVHAYCVMPDHLHLFVAGMAPSSDLRAFVSCYKQRTGFTFHKEKGHRLWQFKFFDHIVRKSGAVESVAWYIWLNPVRKGLCKVPHDYPHSGSLTEDGLRRFRSFPQEEWTPPWRKPMPR